MNLDRVDPTGMSCLPIRFETPSNQPSRTEWCSDYALDVVLGTGEALLVCRPLLPHKSCLGSVWFPDKRVKLLQTTFTGPWSFQGHAGRWPLPASYSFMLINTGVFCIHFECRHIHVCKRNQDGAKRRRRTEVMWNIQDSPPLRDLDVLW